jgi:uncharacterized membrane protein/protein-disulfide isomerase
MSRPHKPPISNIWRIRIPALIALAISLFLIYQKSTGQISSIIGCGGDGGCAQVLGGRWSQWIGVPVTVLAAGMYAAALILSIEAFSRTNLAIARSGLLLMAILAVLAAAWFIGILIFAEKAFCPYCLATHICGIIFAIFVWKSLRHHYVNKTIPALLAFFGIVALAAGQIFGPRPDTHEIVNLGAETIPKTSTKTAKASFAGDLINFDIAATPHLGHSQAKQVVAEFFDYTCKSCRQMHADMALLKKSYPETFLVLLVPCPLHQDCNPYFTGDSSQHRNSCDYVRLSLALWNTAPKKFPEFHEYLMTGIFPPPIMDARTKAYELAGEAAIKAAESHPSIGQTLKQTFESYKHLAAQNKMMPKLLLGGTSVMNGLAKSPEDFVAALKNHFQLPN